MEDNDVLNSSRFGKKSNIEDINEQGDNIDAS